MTGIWLKRLGRPHDCRESSRDILNEREAADHGTGSMWVCDCGRLWVVVEDDRGIHHWEWTEAPSRPVKVLAVNPEEDWEWRFR